MSTYNACSPVTSPSNVSLSPDDIAVEHVEMILYGITMPILSAMGIVGNILNLVVLTRPNLMKIVTYTYFRAMAISDLLTMLMVIPFVMQLTGSKFSSYVGMLFHAHFVLPCLNALVGSSVLVIVAVTVERWMSICFPIQAKNLQSPLRAKLIIASAWFVSFALYLPYCFRKYVSTCRDPTTGHLIHTIEEDLPFMHSETYHIYGWVREWVLRLLPMLVMVVLNIWIVFALRKLQTRRRRLKGGDKKRPSTSAENGNRLLNRHSSSRHSINTAPAAKAEYKRLQEERRLVLLLIGIVVMFFVCVTPAAFLLILPIPDEQFTFGMKLFRAVANLLELTNYALNFYVYVGCSSDFRMTFTSVFCKRCAKVPPRSATDYSTMTPLKSAAIARKSIAVEKLSHSANSTPILHEKRGSRSTIMDASQESLRHL